MEALKDIRELLNLDQKVAALAIRELTGLIKIRQEPAPGTKRKSRWVAEFTPQYAGILRRALNADDDAVKFIQGSLPAAETVTVIIEPNFRKPKRKIPGRDKQGHLTPEGRREIESLLREGKSTTEICIATGCGRTRFI